MSTRASNATVRKSRPVRACLLALAAAGLAGLSLLASACGGSSGAGVARIGSTTTSNGGSAAPSGSGSADPAAFSACMRKHGVPNFPDPDSQGRLMLSPGAGLNPASPQFRAAQRACKGLLPTGGKPDPQAQAAFLKQALRFSQCMRSHGVPNFPDPKASGNGIGLTIGKGSGVDPNSPKFKAAQQACQSLLPGQKTGGGPTQQMNGGPGGKQ
jgi:hypothetical protein